MHLCDVHVKDVGSVFSGRLQTGFIMPIFNVIMNKRLNSSSSNSGSEQMLPKKHEKQEFYNPNDVPLARNS